MAKITYVTADGDARTHEVKTGLSVMQGAVYNDVPGVLAECGGAAACATCRVYVDDAWLERLPPRKPLETSMLDEDDPRYERLRLACQIAVTDSLDGLRVGTPADQH